MNRKDDGQSKIAHVVINTGAVLFLGTVSISELTRDCLEEELPGR